MLQFIDAVIAHTFMQNALLTGVLASISCGIVGTYVVTRRITYIAGAIAHCVLGGMGLARYLAVVKGWDFIQPLHGAIAAALLASLLIGFVTLRAREREDTVIGAIWAVGMALGIIFIANTPGYNEDLMSYLFGNILMVSSQDILIIAGLDLVVLTIVVLFYNQLLAVCFDEEFARVRGVNAELFYLLLLALTGLTVVILVTVVGLIMVIALLTIPVAIASRFTRRLWQTMLAASSISILLTAAGLAISYQPDLPAGATIILLAGFVYLVAALIGRVLQRKQIL